jgi:hypothetical protein
MQAKTLGKIAVPTPGTAVQVSALSGIAGECARIRFEAVMGNTNATFVGVTGLVGSTLANCIKQLAKPTAGAPPDFFELDTEDNTNTLNISDYYVDATTAGEGVLVTFWQR